MDAKRLPLLGLLAVPVLLVALALAVDRLVIPITAFAILSVAVSVLAIRQHIAREQSALSPNRRRQRSSTPRKRLSFDGTVSAGRPAPCTPIAAPTKGTPLKPVPEVESEPGNRWERLLVTIQDTRVAEHIAMGLASSGWDGLGTGTAAVTAGSCSSTDGDGGKITVSNGGDRRCNGVYEATASKNADGFTVYRKIGGAETLQRCAGAAAGGARSDKWILRSEADGAANLQDRYECEVVVASEMMVPLGGWQLTAAQNGGSAAPAVAAAAATAHPPHRNAIASWSPAPTVTVGLALDKVVQPADREALVKLAATVRSWVFHQNEQYRLVEQAGLKISVSRKAIEAIYDSVQLSDIDPAVPLRPDAGKKKKKKKAPKKKSPKKTVPFIKVDSEPDGFTMPSEPVTGMNDFWGSSSHKGQVLLDAELNQSIAKEHDHYQGDLNQTMSHALDVSRLNMTSEYRDRVDLEELRTHLMQPWSKGDLNTSMRAGEQIDFSAMDKRTDKMKKGHEAVLETVKQWDAAYDKLTVIRTIMMQTLQMMVTVPKLAPQVDALASTYNGYIEMAKKLLEMADADQQKTAFLIKIEDDVTKSHAIAASAAKSILAEKEKKKEAAEKAKKAAEKAAADAKAKLAAAAKKAADAKMNPGTTPANPGTAPSGGASAELEKHYDLRNKAKAAEQKLEQCTTGPNQAALVKEFMKKVNGVVNKLSSKHSKLIDTYNKLDQLLGQLPTNYQGINVKELGMYKIVQVIVKKARANFKPLPTNDDPDEVFVYGALASMLGKQKGFTNLFRGELFRRSPLCLPIEPTSKHFPGATSLLPHMGFRGEPPDFKVFYEDTLRFARLYAAFLGTKDNIVQGNFSDASMRKMWEWLVRTVQRKPEAGSTPGIVLAIVSVSGHALASKYKNQYTKLLQQIKFGVIPKLPTDSNAASRDTAALIAKTLTTAVNEQLQSLRQPGSGVDEPVTCDPTKICTKCRWRHCQGGLSATGTC